jgi:poly-gamma-glutamate capsule biosynthesis protein CapA/YwtB (metallophosphatase superfamily)
MAARGALPASETEARRAYACSPIALEGRVVAPDGTPVAGAVLEAHGRSVTSGTDGSFRFPALPRHNALLAARAPGFRPVHLPVHLRQGLDAAVAAAGDVVLVADAPDVARLVVGGDVMLGRRYIDPTESSSLQDLVRRDRPGALVQPSDPVPGSKGVLAQVRPLFLDADLAAVNLECPVTDQPRTPHPSKSYVFFTLPRSLEALQWMGVDYVSTGNNHVHDLLDRGLEDTRRHLEAAGLPHSGSGRNADEAWQPWRTTLRGHPFSFVSANSIDQRGEGDALDLMASERTGGAADLMDFPRVKQAFEGERAQGRVPVAMLHMGLEFSEWTADYAREHMERVTAAGAALVLAHHPHVAQGFSWHNGVLTANSLGNFAFDQSRLETQFGLVADVLLRGDALEGAAAVPVYLEDLQPRPIAGHLADVELRRLAMLSHPGGALLVPLGARGQVALPGADLSVEERVVEVPVRLTSRGWAAVDAREQLRPGESLAGAELAGASAGAARLVAGRDVLRHGDFEDYDVDGEAGEAVQWAFRDGRAHLCQEAPRRGAAALCLRADGGGRSQVDFRERVRLPGFVEYRPNRWLTLMGWGRGTGRGEARARLTFVPISGWTYFGEQAVVTYPGGANAPTGWTAFQEDVRMPREPARPDWWNAAWGVELQLEQSSVERAEDRGVAAFDDLALVAWEEAGQKGRPLALQTPHPRDFVRVEGPPGDYTLRLTVRRHGQPRR